jgi:hypothetical protein
LKSESINRKLRDKNQAEECDPSLPTKSGLSMEQIALSPFGFGIVSELAMISALWLQRDKHGVNITLFIFR